MNITVITLFPEMIETAVSHGVIGQALKAGHWALRLINPRQFTTDNHHTVDDRPFGGGDGMLMLAEPLAQSVEKAKLTDPAARVVHMSPKGRLFNAELAQQWADEQRPLILVSTRYAGVDERFIESYCDDEISIGDYVVSGGELPALVVMDAVLRHRPQTLGNQVSSKNDSFACGLLEAAQYTRPKEWRGLGVPEALVSGDHKKIEMWNELSSIEVTFERRPDLCGNRKMELLARAEFLRMKLGALGASGTAEQPV